MKTIITSIRLNIDLRNKLEQVAHSLHRGKSWVISQALQEYLAKTEDKILLKQAREQSLRAKKQDMAAADLWSDNMDDTGWL